jgi:hypothetical protein
MTSGGDRALRGSQRQRPWRVLIAAAAAALFTVAWRFLTFSGFTNDHYMHVARAQQMLLGDWPVRDFVDPGLPLMYVVSAAARLVGGRAIGTEFALVAGALAIGAALMVTAGTRLSGSVLVATGISVLAHAPQPAFVRLSQGAAVRAARRAPLPRDGAPRWSG